MDNARSVTWQEIRYLVPLIAGLATIIFFLASISFRLDSVQQQQIDAKAQLIQAASTIDLMRTTQGLQGQDIAVIKQILQHNNLSSSNQQPDASIAAIPLSLETPENTSAQLANAPQSQQSSTTNTTTTTTQIIEVTPTPSQQIKPTTFPTPAPTPIVSICVVNICI